MNNRIGSQTGLIVPSSKIDPVTNIGQLFEQMSRNWTDGRAARRMLVASREDQFISIDISKRWVCFHKPHLGDIPIVSPGYSMVGFVKFEAQREFRGLFEVSDSGDDCWWGAVLTQHGYDLAKSGVLEDFKLLPHPFFNPDLFEIEQPKMIATNMRAIGDGVSA